MDGTEKLRRWVCVCGEFGLGEIPVQDCSIQGREFID